MIFDSLFYISIAICFIGTSYKVIAWTRKSVGYQAHSFPHRFSDMVKAVATALFSRHIFWLIHSFIRDVLFQGSILKTSLFRWTMHLLIFAGFLALVFMHALDDVFSATLFPSYYSTLNPFFFLRNLFGLMVLAGIGMALFRRYIWQPARLKNARSDLVALLILSGIILSGVLLEAVKMVSITEFNTMVEDYAGLDYEDEEMLALETYWVKEFALVSDRIPPSFEADVLDLGIETHETYCMDCHSPNKAAFMGYAAAKMLALSAPFLVSVDGVTWLYYIHILICFLGLALLPFTKMFHMVATPVSLITRALENKSSLAWKTHLTKQAMELDACTHCSTCNENCSAGMMYAALKNDYILPSEKMQILRKTALNGPWKATEAKALFQGLYLCTNCDRCTVVCPAGINLKSLWLSVRENLVQQNQNSPLVLTAFSFIRGLNPLNLERQALSSPQAQAFEKTVSVFDRTRPLALAPQTQATLFPLDLPLKETFSLCFGCQNCSTICPVVTGFPKPEESLTLLPHQIMYSLGLGFVDLAKGSAMIWNCLSCYQCQEHCPQNVAVCDILFQLKNRQFETIEDKTP